MRNRIYDENNGLWYERQGDYYLPCLYIFALSSKFDAVRYRELFICNLIMCVKMETHTKEEWAKLVHQICVISENTRYDFRKYYNKYYE